MLSSDMVEGSETTSRAGLVSISCWDLLFQLLKGQGHQLDRLDHLRTELLALFGDQYGLLELHPWPPDHPLKILAPPPGLSSERQDSSGKMIAEIVPAVHNADKDPIAQDARIRLSY
jgi:hypothetical protein